MPSPPQTNHLSEKSKISIPPLFHNQLIITSVQPPLGVSCCITLFDFQNQLGPLVCTLKSIGHKLQTFFSRLGLRKVLPLIELLSYLVESSHNTVGTNPLK
jgi:hypothetical protein